MERLLEMISGPALISLVVVTAMYLVPLHPFWRSKHNEESSHEQEEAHQSPTPAAS